MKMHLSELMKDILMQSLNKTEGLSELEKSDCQVEHCSEILRTVMTTLKPYDLLQENRQTAKQIRLEIFL
jgi:hypothetical protein